VKIALTTVRPRRCLTVWGQVLLLSIAGVSAYFLFSNLYDFLAPDLPPHRGVMVIEGWIHDDALEAAANRFRTGDYSRIVCTGVPFETGSCLLPFRSYPEMTAQRLYRLGLPSNRVSVAVAPLAQRDRTYLAALALRRSLEKNPAVDRQLELVTTGPHARRSLRLFRTALGNDFRIGVVALPDAGYPPERWYAYSEGVRKVVGETIAYAYALLLFRPDPAADLRTIEKTP